MKRLLLVLSLALSLLALPALALAQAQSLKLAIDEPSDGFQDSYAQYFKKQIEAKIPGWKVEVYPVGVLGDPNDQAEQLMTGVIEFFTPSAYMSAIVPLWRIVSVPYIWSNDMAVNMKVMSSSKVIYELLGAAYAKNNMKLLGIFPGGWQYWSSNKPMRKLEDFKNFRMRVMADPLLAEIYKGYGAVPQNIAYAEVYSALQLKQIDGNIQPLYGHEEMSFYEQNKYLTNPFEMPYIAAFVANLDWFNAQTPEQQKIIEEVAREAIGHTIEFVDKLNEERKAKMLSKRPDLVISELTPEEQAPFRALAGNVEKKYIEMAGPDAEKLLKALKAEIKAAEEAK